MPDYYFMTGDETVKDALVDGPKAWYLASNASYQAGQLWNARAIGANLIGATRYAAFLRAIGDPDAVGALNLAVSDYTKQVKPELCASGYPTGCTAGPADGGPWPSVGVHRVRGVFGTPTAATGSSGQWCNVQHNFRINKTFMNGVLVQGILELRNALGSQWPEYWKSWTSRMVCPGML